MRPSSQFLATSASAILLVFVGAAGCESASPGNATGSGGSATGSGGSASGSGGSASGSGGSASGSGGSASGTGGSGSGGSASGSGGSATGSGGSASGSGGSASGSGGSAGTDGGLPPDGGGSGGMVGDGDTPPARPLNVTAAKARLSHSFRASAADPMVSFNDNNQVSLVDPRSTKMVGKLLLPFDGVGQNAGITGPVGDFLSQRGYHVLGIAAFQDYNIIRDDPDFWGDARRTVFEGKKYTTKFEFATINITPADGVMQRVQKGLKYLHMMFPTEDWGYFLNADDTVRWSDVYFTGFSHGASNAARFAMLVRSAGAVSFSGPRDNSCGNTNSAACTAPFAKWFTEVPKTPINRFYAVTGTGDDQHAQHLFTMFKMNYVGMPVNGSTGTPPYGGSHRFIMNGGHAWYCNNTNLRGLCNYLFNVPTENQAGLP